MTVRAFGKWLTPSDSIGKFAVAWLTVAIAFMSLVRGGLEWQSVREQIDRSQDLGLVVSAERVLAWFQTPQARWSELPASFLTQTVDGRSLANWSYELSDSQGQTLGGMAMPRTVGSGGDRAPRADAPLGLLRDALVNGRMHRVADVAQGGALSAAIHRPFRLQLAQPWAERLNEQRAVLGTIIQRELILFAVTLFLLWMIVVLALRPLSALAQRLKRHPTQAIQSIDGGQPVELADLVTLVNELLLSQRKEIDRQGQFLADASHQLRTPLAVLKTQVQGLLGKELSAEETLPRMLLTVDRAAAMTNQLLSRAKADQLVRKHDWAKVDLDRVVREVILHLAPLIAQKELDFALESKPLAIATDAWLLGELLRNLLMNSIHHCARRGRLGVVIRTLPDMHELIVWDSGDGIDELAFPRLFEPFSAARGGTGIGLGLSICRQIADSMGASVQLFNRQDGGRIVGADAVLRWPLAPGGTHRS